jgi:hypothetical protein
MALQIQIRVRRDTQSEWLLKDPTLAAGEIAFETDTYQIKIGNGLLSYGNLPYVTGPEEFPNLSQLQDIIISSPLDGDLLSYNSSVGKWTNTQKENLVDGGNF